MCTWCVRGVHGGCTGSVRGVLGWVVRRAVNHTNIYTLLRWLSCYLSSIKTYLPNVRPWNAPLKLRMESGGQPGAELSIDELRSCLIGCL